MTIISNYVGTTIFFNYVNFATIYFQVSFCDIDSDLGEQVSDDLGAKYGRKNVIFNRLDVTDYPQFEGKI